jgi:hypothetical protein
MAATTAVSQDQVPEDRGHPYFRERHFKKELASLAYDSYLASSTYQTYSSHIDRTHALDDLAQGSFPLTQLAAYYWLSRSEPENALRWAVEALRAEPADAGQVIPSIVCDAKPDNLVQWHATLLTEMTLVHWSSPIPVVAVLGEIPPDEVRNWGRSNSRSYGDSTFEAVLLARLWKILTRDGENPRQMLARELDKCRTGSAFAKCIYLDYSEPETDEYDEVLIEFLGSGDLHDPSVRRALRSRSEYIQNRRLIQSLTVSDARKSEIEDALSR